jgi:uncharacterized protein (TIGR02391 family)
LIKAAPEVVSGLPVDQLGLAILDDLIASNVWNEYNYLLEATREYSPDAAQAIAEAVAWLRGRAFIARDPGKTADSAIFVTRTGRRIAEEGQQTFQVLERLQVGLHPWIEEEVRTQFLIGKYALGVFAAMKAVEIRVRELGDFPEDAVGTTLITEAFRPTRGSLTDPNIPVGEQEGMMALCRGAYAVLRNPAGHRDVDYDDVTEAAEAVATASMLMRILDRIEHRLS